MIRSDCVKNRSPAMTSVSEAVEEYHRSSLRRDNYKKQSIACNEVSCGSLGDHSG